MDDMAGRLKKRNVPLPRARQSATPAPGRHGPVIRALLHVAGLLPLLMASALIVPGSLSALPPALVMAIMITYGRLLAFVSGKRGREEAIAMLECLPFAVFACARGTPLDVLPGLTLAASLAAVAAGLASLEDLLVPTYRGFALALGFSAILVGIALVLGNLEGAVPDPAGPGTVRAIFAATGLLVALGTRYAASRRKR
jgi:hypothetical protein